MKPPKISALRETDLGITNVPVTGTILRDVLHRLFGQINPWTDGISKALGKSLSLTDNVRCDLVSATLTHGVAQQVSLANLTIASSALALGGDTSTPLRVTVAMVKPKLASVTAWFDNPNVTTKVVLLLLVEGQQTTVQPPWGVVYYPKRTTVADAAYAALATDYRIAYTSLSASRVITLPAPAASNAGQEYSIKDESGSAAAGVTLTATPASGNIDGVASKVVVNAAFGVARVYSTGLAWFTA